jgi:hypothetical protein
MSQSLVLASPVKLQNSLETHIVSNNLLSSILLMVANIPSLSTLKLDIELTLHICKLLESMMLKIKVKIDKKQLVLDVLTTVFTLSLDEQALLGKQIDFLFDNKQIVVLKTIWKRLQSASKCVGRVFNLL